MAGPFTSEMNSVVESRSCATTKTHEFATTTMYCARFNLETQGILWPEAINTVTKKLGNCKPCRSGTLGPFSLRNGPDGPMNQILEHLQPSGCVSFATVSTNILNKMEPKSVKIFLSGCYASDHRGDVYKFYNADTKTVFLLYDVHQLMKGHGCVTALDDLTLFCDLVLKDVSTFLPEELAIERITEAKDIENLLQDTVLLLMTTEEPSNKPAVEVVEATIKSDAHPAWTMPAITSPVVTQSPWTAQSAMADSQVR